MLHNKAVVEGKNQRSALSQDYQAQMSQITRAKLSEAETSMMNDQQLLEKNRKAMQFEKHLEDEKKKGFAIARKADFTTKQKKQEFDNIVLQQSKEEDRQLMSEYAMKEIKREQEYKDRLSKINKEIELKQNKYAEYVLQANLKKQMSQREKEENEVRLYQQKQEKEFLVKKQLKEAQYKNMAETIRKQINDKSNYGSLGNQLHDIEVEQRREQEQQVRSIEDLMKSEKRKKQLEYREMLGSQIHFNNNMKLQGTMTAAEKEINRGNLKAYKHGNSKLALSRPNHRS